VNYILVCGEEEEKANTINVRTRDSTNQVPRSIDEFIAECHALIKQRK